MSFTTREVILDADLFRQAQPSWPHPEPLPAKGAGAMTGLVTYKGKDRNGTARTGSTDESPAVLIERLFRQGWIWLTAERDGVEVGGIGCDLDTGVRIWWAER